MAPVTTGDPSGEENQDICRVCRCEGTPDHPLFYPCICTGSIRYIHQDCLLQWLKHSKKRYCELCHHEFAFKPVYSENMPTRIPLVELVFGILRSTLVALSKWSRISLVVVSWGIILPVVARWTWQLFFEDWDFPWEKDDPYRRLVWDWIEGGVVGLVIFCIAMGLLGLRDFIVAYAIPIGDPLEGFDQVHEHPPPVPQVPIPQFPLNNNNNHFNNHDNNNNNNEAEDGHYHPALHDDLDDGWPLFSDSSAGSVYYEDDDEDEDIEDTDDSDEEFHPDDDVPLFRGPLSVDEIVRTREALRELGIAFDGDEDPELMPATSFQHNTLLSSPSETEEDSTEEEIIDEDDMLFEEDLDNEQFLANIEDIVNPQQDMEWPEEVPLEELIGLVGPLEHLLDNLLWIIVLNQFVILVLAFLPYQLGVFTLYLMGSSKYATLLPALVGYAVIFAGCLGYLWIQGDTTPQQAAPRKIIAFISVFIKVCALLTCEVAIAPLLTGWWLDICSLELQTATLRDRIKFFHSAPWTSSFLHWLAGMLLLHNFATFLSLLRNVFRPKVLWFFRDPNDPEFHPLKLMLELPLPDYIRRLTLVSVMYGLLVLTLLWMPVKTCVYLAPSMLPYNIMLSHPIELLSLNLAIPFIQEQWDPTGRFRALVAAWLRKATSLLGICDKLMPQSPDDITPTGDIPRPSLYLLRVVGLLLMAWFTLYLTFTAFLTGPVYIGRSLVSLFTAAPLHELYTISLGVAIIVVMLHVCFTVSDAARLRRLINRNFIRDRHWIVRFQICLTAVIVCGLLPVLVGLVLDLVLITPLKAPFYMSPMFCLWQCWAIGMMFLKLAHQAATTGPDSQWKTALARISQNGVSNFDMTLVMDLVLPIASTGLLILTIPYILTRGILPLLGLSQLTCSLIFRSIYPIFLISFALKEVANILSVWLSQMSNHVRDTKYLVGEKLINYEAEPTNDLDTASASNNATSAAAVAV